MYKVKVKVKAKAKVKVNNVNVIVNVNEVFNDVINGENVDGSMRANNSSMCREVWFQ